MLCAGTLAGASIQERAAAAQAGGFRGLSLFAGDYRRARADGLTDDDLRGLLAEAGLEIGELDPLISWLPGAEQGLELFRASEDEFYRIADALGARSINAIVFAAEKLPRDLIVEHFAALCDRAVERGLLVHLEFMPWTQIRDAVAAAEIVTLADRPNAGIMFDSWHHFRSDLSNEDLRARIPIERILAVQLSDAPSEPEADPVAETLNRRRLPGDGDIDLPELIRTLREGGSPAPFGVEIFATDLSALSPKEVARRCANATRTVIERSLQPRV